MQLIARATIQIQKPVTEVFEGIIDPSIMTKYFISESTGRMETGKELIWKFAEFSKEISGLKLINLFHLCGIKLGL